jgi:hypothetical protein
MGEGAKVDSLVAAVVGDESGCARVGAVSDVCGAATGLIEVYGGSNVRIPIDAIIPDDKLIRYLLVYQARNDKSQFLAQAGFTQDNPALLRLAILSMINSGEAITDRTNEYGTFYQVEGALIGNNGVTLWVTTIWLLRSIDGKFQFVTLKPAREVRDDA